MGNNSSKPVSSSKKKNTSKKSNNNSRKSSDEINTVKSNTSKVQSSSAPVEEKDVIGSKQPNKVASSSSNNKPLLKKKNRSSPKAVFNSSSSDIDNQADHEDIGTADIDDDYRSSVGSSKKQQNEYMSIPKSHKRSASQGSILTNSNQGGPSSITGRRKSYNGASVLTKTSSRNSNSANDHHRPVLRNGAKSTDSVFSSQHTPKMSSRKSSMSEVPASMIMSLEPKASILKRTFSNVSSSASQSRHASDNALTDGYDDEDEDDDYDEDYDNIEQKIKDGVYKGYNPSEVYEDIYKSGNISRGILRNSNSNGNIRSPSVGNSRKGRNSSSSIPGGLSRSSTKGSTSNSEINFSGTRKFSGSGSETNYHHGNVVDMADGLVLNSNDVPPPLIHRHSSFGTNTDNDYYPQKLDYSNQNNNEVFEDEYPLKSDHEHASDKEGFKTHSRKHSGEYYGDVYHQQANSSQPGTHEYMVENGVQQMHLDSDEMYNQDPNAADLGDNAQLRNPEHTYIQGPGKNKKPLDLDATIQKLLDAGYSGKRTKNVILKNSEIHQICAIAGEIFMQQPSLVELSPPVKIVGDVHGQFHDLIRMFEKCGFPPTSNYLFLGDYVDRGKQSLETILLLLCYKIKYPENFFLLRGNHECASVTRVYGFYDECKRRCNVRTWKYFIDTFNTMPLASIVAGKIFCVHGGLSPVLNSMDEIRLVSRPTDVPDFGLINDLLWSDPTDSVNEWEDNERGVSYCYNKVAINKFLNRFGFDLVCRAHMVVEDGYEFFNDHTLVTVFSAPNYCGEFDNWGAVMSVNHELLCSFELLEPLDSIALKQVMKKGKIERKLAMEDTQDPNILSPQETAE